MTPCDPQPYDPDNVPEWAREAIARIAREHPEDLACHLDHVAQIEAAKRYAAEHPPPPVPPGEARDFLHLSAIRTWQALASGQPAPDLDPAGLEQDIWEAFVTSDGHHQVDLMCEDWLTLARQCGLAVEDQDGDLRPRRARRHQPHHHSGDLVRPDRRAPDLDRHLQHPPQVPGLPRRMTWPTTARWAAGATGA